MKIKISIIFLFITIAFSCQDKIKKEEIFNKKAEKVDKKDNLEMPHIEVITTELPLKLDKVNFEDNDLIQQISDGKMSVIENEIKKYYFEECNGYDESPYSIKDIYLKTIQVNNSSNQILFWVILKHISGKINSKILFFDQTKKEFSKHVHNFNIHALYYEKDRKLKATNLKELLKLDFPEIELVDFDRDEFTDFKLKRLYHNGTANAIEEIIIEINNNADTLSFKKEWISN